MPAFWKHEEGTSILVYATPKSSKTNSVGFHDGRLKVAIKAPPVDGAANEELLKFLRKKLGLCREEVELLRGQTNRRKTILVKGMQPEEVRHLLISE